MSTIVLDRVSGDARLSRAPQCVVLIPAHNEEATIAATVESVRRQTASPNRIVVIADNCSDRTADEASRAGAEVTRSVGNTSKKSGALNQALPALLADLHDIDFVLVMDADTSLAPAFLATALAAFGPGVGAVGGSFFCSTEDSLLRVMQGNEYARYVREISRRKNARANVLTGAGSVFRVDVLRQVEAARSSGRLPGAGVYQQNALTEDNELTLAIRHLGYRVVSPKAAALYTDAPNTTRELFHQRLRWRRGAMENLRDYGVTKVTLPYLLRMVWTCLVSLVSWFYLVMLAVMAERGVPFSVTSFWALVFVVYLFERWWSVRSRPVSAQLVALLFPLEMLYDLFQQAVFWKAAVDFARRGEQRWTSERPSDVHEHRQHHWSGSHLALRSGHRTLERSGRRRPAGTALHRNDQPHVPAPRSGDADRSRRSPAPAGTSPSVLSPPPAQSSDIAALVAVALTLGVLAWRHGAKQAGSSA